VNDDAHEYGGPGNGQFVTGDMNTFGVVYMSSVGRGIVYGKPASVASVASVRVKARHSGKCADVNGASTSDGAAIIQWTCHTGANQQWQFEDVGGYFRLKANHSGKCMDLASQSSNDLVALVQATCGTGTSQQWTKEDMGGGYYRLRSRYSGKCADVTGASTSDGTAIIQYTCGTGTNQQWSDN